MSFKPIAAAILLASTLAIAACSEEPAPVEAKQEGVAGLEISNARVVLNAVKGNPAAIYFDLAYDGERATSLFKAEVAGAESAMMHDYGEWAGKMEMNEMPPLVLNPGDKVSFEPGGKHIMVMGPDDTIAAGGTVDVTLKVIDGRTQTFAAEVKAAGDAS